MVFAAEASWKGRLEPLGFEEDLVDLSAPAAPGQGERGQGERGQGEPGRQGQQDAGAFWKKFIATTAPEFRKPTIEQLGTWIRPVWAELISGAPGGGRVPPQDSAQLTRELAQLAVRLIFGAGRCRTAALWLEESL